MSLAATSAIFATLLAGTSLVGLGLKRRARGGMAVAPVPAGMPAAGPEAGHEAGFGAVRADAAHPMIVADHLAARVEDLLSAQTRAQADALADLKAEILGLKSDVEWLAGERMIEQAIALAQSGVEAEEIGRELGMTRDAAETIVAFRRH
ncbi:hypothetical protein [Paragemmobacter straminiformis]|uniref:DUF2802 domain-containing protein n=1 Tax=Paragemmobacter straminiformis TaxID=2045119 RepID=A0A842I5A4_9RHOB|nr:hypothetical protein [Gemmobacter straminiformis]MBC2834799.1 hypothetical protein [Gemmobacter straminiformis]